MNAWQTKIGPGRGCLSFGRDRRGILPWAGAVGILAAAGSAWAQPYIFQHAVGDNFDNRAYSLEQTSDGGYVTAGVRQTADGNQDILVCRYNPKGSLLWDDIIGGTGNEVGFSVRQTSDGGFIVAAETNSLGVAFGIALCRLDPAGNLLWARVYKGAPLVGGRVGVAVREFLDGGFVVCGRYRPTAVNGQYGNILRVTPAGAVIFNNFYIDAASGAPSFESFADVRVLPNGRITVCGFDSAASTAPRDALLMQAGPAGNVVWTWRYGQTAFQEEADSLESQFDGGFAMTASDTSIGSPGGTRFIKTDGAGNLLASRQWGTFLSANAALREDIHGGLVAGGKWTLSTGRTAAAMLTCDSLGVVNRTELYGGFTAAADDAGEAAIPTDDCGYALAGWTQNFGFGQADKYLVKTTNRLISGCNEISVHTPDGPKALPMVPVQMNVFSAPETLVWQPTVRHNTFDKLLCIADWCKADFNGDGFVNGDDFDDYNFAFGLGIDAADFNCDGFVNGDDFDQFVAAFEAGC